jgi:hypothetical protein
MLCSHFIFLLQADLATSYWWNGGQKTPLICYDRTKVIFEITSNQISQSKNTYNIESLKGSGRLAISIFFFSRKKKK